MKEKIIERQKELIEHLEWNIQHGVNGDIWRQEYNKLKKELTALEAEQSTGELYEQVYIRSVEDLPDSDENLFIHTTDCEKGDNGLRVGYLSSEDYLWYYENSGDIIKDIDWYLRPVESKSSQRSAIEKIMELDEKDGLYEDKCPNCREIGNNCACMRNICVRCGKPVGNVTFAVCDDCWESPNTGVKEQIPDTSQNAKQYNCQPSTGAKDSHNTGSAEEIVDNCDYLINGTGVYEGIKLITAERCKKLLEEYAQRKMPSEKEIKGYVQSRCRYYGSKHISLEGFGMAIAKWVISQIKGE